MPKTSKQANITNSPNFWKNATIILLIIIALTQIFSITINPKFLKNKNEDKSSGKDSSLIKKPSINIDVLAKEVLPQNGVKLPITWNDLGKKMTKDGVIDETKLRSLMNGSLGSIEEKMLTQKMTEPIVMNFQNSRFILDMLWAFGLSNKNDILEKGEMTDKKYGGDASKFASTGGWSLAKGSGFSHYSKHKYIVLTSEQQALVEDVSRNIYRPCCGNSTHFPDCNHGMAMLGLLELMASNNVSKEDMYNIALKVNTLWFPQTYIDIATYFKEQGKNWDELEPKTLLSAEYSSAQGYQTTRQKIQSLPKPQQGGGGCGA